MRTSDTLVTNFGYHNGVATPWEAVLQAGTCSDGRPDRHAAGQVQLRQPARAAGPDLAARRPSDWNRLAGVRPLTVAMVRPGRGPADLLTVVDIETGDTFPQSPGGGSVSGAEILVSDTPGRGSRIYRLTLGSRSLAPVTTVHDVTGRNLDLFDVAEDSHGNVFAEANSQLSRIDLATGLANADRVPPRLLRNALAFDGNDVLFSASEHLAVNCFDPSTGAAAVVAELPASSSGDVVFLNATTLYATVSASGGDLLVRVDVQSGAVKTVGSTKASSIYGLFVDHRKLYGVTPTSFSCRGGDLLRIDPDRPLHAIAGSDAGLGGAATRPPNRTPPKGQTGTPPCTNAVRCNPRSCPGHVHRYADLLRAVGGHLPDRAERRRVHRPAAAAGAVWKVAPSGSCSSDIVPSDIYRACARNELVSTGARRVSGECSGTLSSGGKVVGR